jgi:hypothetical protein
MCKIVRLISTNLHESRSVLFPSTGALKETTARMAPLNNEDHGHMSDVRLESLHCLRLLTDLLLLYGEVVLNPTSMHRRLVCRTTRPSHHEFVWLFQKLISNRPEYDIFGMNDDKDLSVGLRHVGSRCQGIKICKN